MPDETTNGHGANGQSGPAMPADQLLMAAEFRMLASEVIQRYQFARQHGLTFGGKRDLNEILGYSEILTAAQHYHRYARGGIAGRIVDAPINATWRGTVEIRENQDPHDDTPFEKAWKDFDKRLSVQHKLWRVDKLSVLSNYAVILIGVKDTSDLSEELPKGNSPDQIIYLSAFGGAGGAPTVRQGHRVVNDDADVSIFEYEIDPTNERYGLPKSYQLRKAELMGVQGEQKTIHWSRVIHVAEGCLFDDVFGQPALERVWNLLDDLDKVTGGGAEAFWLRANQGLQLDISKDMALTDALAAKEDLKQQAEDYKHQLTRWLRTRGVTVSTLGSDVANFAAPADAILTQIAGAKAIPKRILTGSEMGELASSQDRDNWKDQVNGRQTQHAGPNIVRPLIDRLMTYGYLPTVKAYEVVWPHIEVMTETEKAEGAARWAQVNATQGTPVFLDSEIRDHWYNREPLTEAEIQQQIELKKKAAEPPPPPEPPPGAEQTGKEQVEEDKEGELLKAAMAPLSDDEREMLKVLELAMDCGNFGVVDKILHEALSHEKDL